MTLRATKGPRILQLTVMALVAMCTVQVGWWLYDQHRYAVEKVRELQALYTQQVAAADALLAAGTPPARVRALLPQLLLNGGRAEVSPAIERGMLAEEHRRTLQYMWEGSFFLLALGACIVVIARALRAEALVMLEQDNFLQLVSHQFKTPLASLQLSLETMALRPLSAEQSRVLTERMLSDLSRMEGMVTRILESARIERGRIELRHEPVDLGAAVRRVTAQAEERARQERISLGADIESGLMVLTDPLALDVILRNLLENSLAAVAPVGGGSIVFSGRRLGPDVELTVRDSGVGFRPADSTRLFEKFTRLHPGGGSYHGTGLGLYIVRRLMQLMGGRVSAHSDGAGQGARFVLLWPGAPADARHGSPLAATLEAGGDTRGGYPS